jgi:hypothetical protein
MIAPRGTRVSPLVVAVLAVSCAAPTAAWRAARAGEPPTANEVRWNPTTNILGCASGDAELTVPREWKDRVYVIAPDLVAVVPQPATGALLVTVSPSFLRGKRAGVLGDLPEIWKELHRQATGVDLRDGDVQGTFRAADGRIVVEYAYDPPPPSQIEYKPSAGPDLEDDHPPAPPPFAYDPQRPQQWKLVYVAAGRCRVAALDRAGPGDRPRLTPLLDELRVAAGLIPR